MNNLSEQPNNCKHLDFACSVNVNRIEDIGRFSADVKINCAQCGLPFRFIGLPAGVDLNGAAVSVDGEEARLAIAPKGEVIPPVENITTGFTVRRVM